MQISVAEVLVSCKGTEVLGASLSHRNEDDWEGTILKAQLYHHMLARTQQDLWILGAISVDRPIAEADSMALPRIAIASMNLRIYRMLCKMVPDAWQHDIFA